MEEEIGHVANEEIRRMADALGELTQYTGNSERTSGRSKANRDGQQMGELSRYKA
jgi:hypothetical protein